MQLLCQLDTADYDGWRAEFDRDAAERMEAGLSLLQIWRDADSRARVLMLLEANDRPRAEAWLARREGFGGPMTATFLDLA